MYVRDGTGWKRGELATSQPATTLVYTRRTPYFNNKRIQLITKRKGDYQPAFCGVLFCVRSKYGQLLASQLLVPPYKI